LSRCHPGTNHRESASNGGRVERQTSRGKSRKGDGGGVGAVIRGRGSGMGAEQFGAKEGREVGGRCSEGGGRGGDK